MTRFRFIPPVLTLLALLALPLAVAQAEMDKPRLEIVAQMKERPGNIAVASDGRMFVSVHPFDNPAYKVLEVKPDGTTKPYPNEKWAKEPAGDGIGLFNVIHLQVMGSTLYIMDMGTPRSEPKLVAWDIAKNALKQVWYLPRHVTTAQSFNQDFAMTPDEKNIFIADMGQADLSGKASPAIIHLDLVTGMARRILDGHASTRPTDKPMVAAGQPLKLTKEGKEIALYLGLNPITMDPKGEWLYYGPMGQGLLYKIRVRDALDLNMSADTLADKIEVVGAKPPGDGMIIDSLENIFISSVADGAIGVINNKGKYSTWVRDPLLSWPDGLAFGPDNGLYVTVNQLHLAPAFNVGEEKSTPPYMIIRIVGGRPLPEKK